MNDRLPPFRLMRIGSLSAWKVGLFAAVGALLLVGILALAFATFLVVAPVAAAIAGIGGWLAARRVRRARAAARGWRDRRGEAEDANFTLIDPPGRRDRP